MISKQRRVPKDDWRIDSRKSAFVVIDMQRALLDPNAPRECVGASDMVPNINLLAKLCRQLKIPVIFIRHSYRSDLSDIGLRRDFKPPEELNHDLALVEGKAGVDFHRDLNITEGDYVVTKIRYSAFAPGSSTLERLLRGFDIDTIIVCGVATDVCVAVTIADAMMLEFKVFCVGDLTSTFSEAQRMSALAWIDERFAKVTTFEEVKTILEELTQKAGI